MTVQLTQSGNSVLATPTRNHRDVRRKIFIPAAPFKHRDVNVAVSFGSGYAPAQPFALSLACTKTGGFSAPQQNSIMGQARPRRFTTPLGAFTPHRRGQIDGGVQLDVFPPPRPRRRPELPGQRPPGPSPDGLDFVVVGLPC